MGGVPLLASVLYEVLKWERAKGDRMGATMTFEISDLLLPNRTDESGINSNNP